MILDDISVPAPEPGPRDWNDDGVLILPGFYADRPTLLQRYCDAWEDANGPAYIGDGLLSAERPGGWPDATPYMRHPEILDLFDPLAPHLEQLLGEPAGLHLNLTGWVTTARNWHQDSYLNPPHVGDYYAAVWVALDDIHPDSGPFQYVPGSHRWPQVTRETIAPFVNLSDPSWPTHSEQVLTPVFEAELERRQAEVVTYLPKKGDVLIWHGRLLHRGSRANRPGHVRKAIIAHFSGVDHRQDMPEALEWQHGWFFPIGGRQPALYKSEVFG